MIQFSRINELIMVVDVSHFVNRVAQRRHLLDLAVLFYTHLAEVTSWLEALRHDLMENMNLCKTVPKLEESQVISSHPALSEHFQSNFRAISEQFRSSSGAVPEQFWSSSGAISEQLSSGL